MNPSQPPNYILLLNQKRLSWFGFFTAVTSYTVYTWGDAEARETPADQPWGRDPATIPPRQFLYGKHYTRGAVGATIGAGGRAKTTLSCEEAVSMAVGRDLMAGEPLKSGPLSKNSTRRFEVPGRM
jgi:AAA domain